MSSFSPPKPSQEEINEVVHKIEGMEIEDPFDFLITHPEFSNNKKVAKAVLDKTPLNLFLFSKEIQNDKEIVEFAVNKNAEALNHVPLDYLRVNYRWVREVLKKETTPSSVYETLPHPIKMIPSVTKAFVDNMFLNWGTTDSAIFNKLPEHFFVIYDDERKEIALEFVNRDGLKINDIKKQNEAYASDYDVAKKAVMQNAVAIIHIDEKYRDNDEFAWIVANHQSVVDGAGVIVNFSNRLLENRELIKTALSHCGALLAAFEKSRNSVLRKYCSDLELVTIALNNHPTSIVHVDQNLPEYHSLVIDMVEKHHINVDLLPDREKYSFDVMSILLHKDIFSLKEVLTDLKDSNVINLHIQSLGKEIERKTQEWLLSTMKNTVGARNVTRKNFSPFWTANLLDIVVKPATKDTLYYMKDAVCGKSSAMEWYIKQELGKRKIMDIEMDDKVDVLPIVSKTKSKDNVKKRKLLLR